MKTLGLLLLLFSLSWVPTNRATAAEPVDFESVEVQRDFALKAARDLSDRLKLAKRTDASLANMVSTAAWKLKKEGHPFMAADIQSQYRNRFSGFLEAMVLKQIANGGVILPTDLGDHEPLSQWLADWYQKLEDTLGEDICKLLHLDDINIVNYAIPVVFFRVPEYISIEEYKLHFVPLGGVCAYWVTWGACTAATFGTGAFLICTPAGMAAEWLVVKYVAPPVSDWVWERFNPYSTTPVPIGAPIDVDFLMPAIPDLSDMPTQ